MLRDAERADSEISHNVHGTISTSGGNPPPATSSSSRQSGASIIASSKISDGPLINIYPLSEYGLIVAELDSSLNVWNKI